MDIMLDFKESHGFYAKNEYLFDEELELMRRDGEGSIVSPKASRTSYEFTNTILDF
jgi:hypothetical protein